MEKVVVLKCESYQEEEVYQAVKRGINILGGIEKFVLKTEKILLKPNLLIGKSPEKSVTTHPSIFNAIIQILKENDYKNIFYGDSPGFGNPVNVAKKAVLKNVADKYDVELVDFRSGKLKSFSSGNQCKQFDIANGVLDCDSIISLPKMKTHMLTKITGGVKNILGCVYGLNKGAFHAKFEDAYTFSKMLVDLNLYLKPKIKLHILDAVVAMEGQGPNAGDSKSMKVILISDNAIAIDSIFCKLINLDPKLVPTNVYGKEYGLGDFENIELLEDNGEALINKSFKVNREKIKVEKNSQILKFLRKPLLKKPVIEKSKCIKCGICIKSCPLKDKALNFKNSKKNVPVYDYNKCIRCFCCQEMCPEHAIKVEIPFLGKLIFK